MDDEVDHFGACWPFNNISVPLGRGLIARGEAIQKALGVDSLLGAQVPHEYCSHQSGLVRWTVSVLSISMIIWYGRWLKMFETVRPSASHTYRNRESSQRGLSPSRESYETFEELYQDSCDALIIVSIHTESVLMELWLSTLRVPTTKNCFLLNSSASWTSTCLKNVSAVDASNFVDAHLLMKWWRIDTTSLRHLMLGVCTSFTQVIPIRTWPASSRTETVSI